MAMASSSDGQSVQDWDGNWEGWQWQWQATASGHWTKVWTKTKEAEKDVADKEPGSEGEVDIPMEPADTDGTESETSSKDSGSGRPVCCSHCVRWHCVGTTHVI